LAPLIETGEWPPWCNDWNYIMTSIKECVNDHGLRAAFVHQDVTARYHGFCDRNR
jgi:hypothetical protein